MVLHEILDIYNDTKSPLTGQISALSVYLCAEFTLDLYEVKGTSLTIIIEKVIY